MLILISQSRCTLYCFDVDFSQRGPCVVDAMDKFTGTAEVLWRKRDSMATLSERAPRPLPGQAFIAFLGTLHQG